MIETIAQEPVPGHHEELEQGVMAVDLLTTPSKLDVHCAIYLQVFCELQLISYCGNHFCWLCIESIKIQRESYPLCQRKDLALSFYIFGVVYFYSFYPSFTCSRGTVDCVLMFNGSHICVEYGTFSGTHLNLDVNVCSGLVLPPRTLNLQTFVQLSLLARH